MKELYYVPSVEYPTEGLGITGRILRTKVELEMGTDYATNWHEAYRAYWNLISQRVDELPLQPQYILFKHMTPKTLKLGEIQKRMQRGAAQGSLEDEFALKLLSRGGRLTHLDSHYLNAKMLTVSSKMTDAIQRFDNRVQQAAGRELMALRPALSAYRGSVINNTLGDNQQGVLIEYGDTGGTLDFLKEDIEVKRVIGPEEYKELTAGIPQVRKR